MKRSPTLRLVPLLRGTLTQRGALFGSILLAALLSFEIFNFSTTEFALHDLLGDLRFAGIRWATILAIAFCGIDFAGIARLFTPEQGADEPAEVWYLFGAWLLAAAMNAALTWWGVSVAILNHQAAASAVISPATMTRIVPVFVAVMVWLIRVLIIGTFSIAGERLFSMGTERPLRTPSAARRTTAARPLTSTLRPAAPKPAPSSLGTRSIPTRYEPTYHPVGMSARPREETSFPRR